MASKLTKKELEQPDEFHTLGWRALQYVSEHRDKLYLAGAIILLVIIIFGGWYFYRSSYEQKAQNLYSSAYATYAMKNSSPEVKRGLYLKAIRMYEKLIEKYPNSQAATLSYYNLGNLYFNVDNMERAVTVYKAFLERSKKDDLLIALAYHGLGYCYEETGEYDTALESFEDSSKRVQGTQFEYINYADIARIYEKMGRQQEALEFYRKAAGKTVNPVMEMLIKKKIASLAPRGDTKK